MGKPIKPSEVKEKKKEIIPDAVFDAFNHLIAKYCNEGIARFSQLEVLKEIVKNKPEELMDVESLEEAYNIIFEKRWLYIEEIYSDAGWCVEFDNRGFSHIYPASFTFTKPIER